MTSLDARTLTRQRGPHSTERDLTLVGGGAALAAGTIHLAVVPEHLGEVRTLGLLFLALGLGQVGLALLLWGRRAARGTTTLTAVVVLHLVVILLYLASRTVDLPFLPPHDAGHAVEHLPVAGGVGDGVPVYPGSRIEEVGVLDLACLFAELVLVGVVTSLLPERARSRVATLTASVALAALVAWWVVTGR